LSPRKALTSYVAGPALDAAGWRHRAAAWSPLEHALISLLALNGLRVSEATGADIEHLGLERRHRTLTITRKDGKVVAIPLAPRTARAIDLAIGERTSGPVFLAADGKRLDRHGARRIIRKTARRAGITKAVWSRPQIELPLPSIRCVLVGDVPPPQGKREPPMDVGPGGHRGHLCRARMVFLRAWRAVARPLPRLLDVSDAATLLGEHRTRR
jgi:Phage integrase family